ncbi:MAG: hypothetical protein WC998_07780 [Candidatus Paceibacterota bacterium]|jgi:hypothetical protein
MLKREQLTNWMIGEHFDDVFNLEELATEQMEEIYNCFAYNKDADDVERALDKCLDNINNPKIWK